MAAHRYWRLYIKKVDNGDTPGYCTIVEMELRGTIGGADLTTSTTPVSASSYNGGSTGPKVVDNSNSTYWTTANNDVSPAHPAWLIFDLGSPVVISEITIKNLTGYPSRSPCSFVFDGSDDGVTWPEYDQVIPDQTGWSNGEVRSFTVAKSFFGGTAKLDTGVSASSVQIFNWDYPYNCIASIIPEENGNWAITTGYVNKALVVARGPDGYRPLAHGPVVPIP